MTKSLPCRRTNLQFSQMRFTLDRTFIADLTVHSGVTSESFILLTGGGSGSGFFVARKNFHAVGGDGQGVLDVGTRGPVAGDDGPVVTHRLHVRAAEVDHRLDGE